MSILNRRSFVTISIMYLATSISLGWGQRSRSLRQRIPKADPKKYRDVQNAKDWRNPYLIVRSDGIEIEGVTKSGNAIPVDSIAGVLEGLPDSAWPYGLVVAVQENGIVSEGDIPRIKTNRRIVVGVLSKLGVAVDLWPSA